MALKRAGLHVPDSAVPAAAFAAAAAASKQNAAASPSSKWGNVRKKVTSQAFFVDTRPADEHELIAKAAFNDAKGVSSVVAQAAMKGEDGALALAEAVRFQQKNLHFLLKNLDFLIRNLHFLIRNLHFLIRNLHFYIKTELDDGVGDNAGCAGGGGGGLAAQGPQRGGAGEVPVVQAPHDARRSSPSDVPAVAYRRAVRPALVALRRVPASKK